MDSRLLDDDELPVTIVIKLVDELLSADEINDLLEKQDIKSISVNNAEWITAIDKHLKMYQGYEYIDSEWWEERKKDRLHEAN